MEAIRTSLEKMQRNGALVDAGAGRKKREREVKWEEKWAGLTCLVGGDSRMGREGEWECSRVRMGRCQAASLPSLTR